MAIGPMQTVTIKKAWLELWYQPKIASHALSPLV
jgi:hypothetical protein